MSPEQFELIVQEQMAICQKVLLVKAGEYAPDEDRLHNFRTASLLENHSMRKALAGMMAKHTISIYDMCNSSEPFDGMVWEEKITDHLNYLFLLKAVVIEEAAEGVF